MATVTITINTDNAAFEDDMLGEVARILETQVVRDMRSKTHYCVGGVWIKAKAKQQVASVKVTDLNGNTCGTVSIQED